MNHDRESPPEDLDELLGPIEGLEQVEVLNFSREGEDRWLLQILCGDSLLGDSSWLSVYREAVLGLDQRLEIDEVLSESHDPTAGAQEAMLRLRWAQDLPIGMAQDSMTVMVQERVVTPWWARWLSLPEGITLVSEPQITSSIPDLWDLRGDAVARTDLEITVNVSDELLDSDVQSSLEGIWRGARFIITDWRVLRRHDDELPLQLVIRGSVVGDEMPPELAGAMILERVQRRSFLDRWRTEELLILRTVDCPRWEGRPDLTDGIRRVLAGALPEGARLETIDAQPRWSAEAGVVDLSRPPTQPVRRGVQVFMQYRLVLRNGDMYSPLLDGTLLSRATGVAASIGISATISGAVSGTITGSALARRDSRLPRAQAVAANPWVLAPSAPQLRGAALRNVERRRIVLEEFGVEKFLELYGERLETIDEDEDGQKLLSVDGWFCFVQVRDGTDPSKLYHLRVPPGFTSLRAAVAWTFGLRESEYTTEVES